MTGSRLPASADAALFRSFFERSGIPIARLDRRARIVLANADFQRRFAHGRHNLRGTAFSELLHPDYQERIELWLSTLNDAPYSSRFTAQIAVRSEDRPLMCQLTALADDETEPAKGVTVLLDEERNHDPRTCRSQRHKLSQAEARILEGIGAGASTTQLASALFLSRGGIEYHVTSLMRRFKVRKRPALIAKAYEAGVLRTGSWPPRVPGTQRAAPRPDTAT